MPSSMHESDNFTLSRSPFPLVATSFLSGRLVLRWSDLGPDFYDLCSNLDLFAQSRVVTGGGEEKEERLSDRIYRLWEKRAWL